MVIDPNYSEENEMDIFVNSILLSDLMPMPMPMPMDDSFIPNQHIGDFDSILEWDNIVDSSIKNSSEESIDSFNLIPGQLDVSDYEMPSSLTRNNLLELDNIIDSSIKNSPSDESIVNLIPGQLDISDYGYEMPSSSSSSQNNLYVVGISENCRIDSTPENSFNSPPVTSTDLIIPSNSVEDEFNYHYHYDCENDYGIGAILINTSINRPPLPQPQPNSDNFSMSCSSSSLLHQERVFGNRLMNIPTIPLKKKKKKAEPWTVFEHMKFLIGLQMFGKGDWKSISRKLVITKTPSQVASHAQKFFIRQELSKEGRVKKPSIHDITTVSEDFVKSLFGHVVDNGNSSVTNAAATPMAANSTTEMSVNLV